MLSNLLQELALARDHGRKRIASTVCYPWQAHRLAARLPGSSHHVTGDDGIVEISNDHEDDLTSPDIDAGLSVEIASHPGGWRGA